MFLSKLSRGIIAIFMVVTFAVLGFVSPSYAAPTSTILSAESSITQQGNYALQQGDDKVITYFESSPTFSTNDSSDDIFWWLINALDMAGKTIVGTAVVCYTIDGVATLVFPPAGALLPFCPALGGAASSQIMTNIVQ